MAGVLTVAKSLLTLPRTIGVARVPSSSLPATKYDPVLGLTRFRQNRHRTTILPSKKLVIRAARIESRGYSIGFRAPDFELPEPLTGKVWKLDDFESYPALLDGPDYMAEDAKILNYPFPYLYDGSQEVAKTFKAVYTPEFFLFKKDGRRPFELAYHGQFDDSRPSNNIPITGRDLSLAIDNVLSGQPVNSNQKPSVGCSIKWNPELNE